MDLKIVGILDIIFISLAIIVAIIGYIKGFMTKMVKTIISFVVLGLSILLSGHFALLLKKADIIYPTIYKSNYSKLDSAVSKLNTGDKSYLVVKNAYKCPNIFARILTQKVGENDINLIADKTADYITIWCLKIICFIVLYLLFLIIFIIIVAIIKKARENEVVRTVDGILGIFLYLAIYIFTFSFFLFVLKIFYDNGVTTDRFDEFLETDLQLKSNHFRLTKYLYEGNIFESVYELFK